MKCTKCGYQGQGIVVYQSSTQSEVTKCPMCREVSTSALPHIKGFCKTCKHLMSDSMIDEFYCYLTSETTTEKDYCSHWEAKNV